MKDINELHKRITCSIFGWPDGEIEKTHQLLIKIVKEADAEADRLRDMIPSCDCSDPKRCWEPCGHLGHSEAYMQTVDEHAVEQLMKMDENPTLRDI